MASYKELRAQIRRLEAEAELQRRRELKTLIADIKSKIAAHGLTAADLGFSETAKEGINSKKKATTKKNPIMGKSRRAKYRDPESGLTWAGVGHPPRWLVAAEKAGKKRQDFAVD